MVPSGKRQKGKYKNLNYIQYKLGVVDPSSLLKFQQMDLSPEKVPYSAIVEQGKTESSNNNNNNNYLV